MRRPWVMVPLLLAFPGCVDLNPALRYQEAAKKLRFTLDRVEPSIHLALPLDQSRLNLRLVLGVDNPTDVNLRARGFSGNLSLEEGEAKHGIGRVALTRGLDLPAKGRGQLPVDLSFSYDDLRHAWSPISAAVRGHRGVWRLEGQMTLDVLGIGFTVPVRATKTTGNP